MRGEKKDWEQEDGEGKGRTELTRWNGAGWSGEEGREVEKGIGEKGKQVKRKKRVARKHNRGD